MLRVNYITFNFYSIELEETLKSIWTSDTKNPLILTVDKPTMTKMYFSFNFQEFNDDDFKHQPSPSKKVFSLINLSSVVLQVSKCTSIRKFWQSSSWMPTNVIFFQALVYRDRVRNTKKPKSEIENIIEEAKVTRDESRNSKYAKRV